MSVADILCEAGRAKRGAPRGAHGETRNGLPAGTDLRVDGPSNVAVPVDATGDRQVEPSGEARRLRPQQRDCQLAIDGIDVAMTRRAHLRRDLRRGAGRGRALIAGEAFVAMLIAGRELDRASGEIEERAVEAQACRPNSIARIILDLRAQGVDRRRIVAGAVAEQVERGCWIGIGQRLRDAGVTHQIAKEIALDLAAIGSRKIDRPRSEIAFEATAGGERVDGADAARRTNFACEIILDRDRLAGANRIDIERICGWHRHRSKCLDVGDQVEPAMRIECAPISGDAGPELLVGGGIERDAFLLRQDIDPLGLVDQMGLAGKQFGGRQGAAILARRNRIDAPVVGDEIARCTIGQAIVRASEARQIIGRDRAVGTGQRSTKIIFGSDHETAGRPALSRSLAQLILAEGAVCRARIEARLETVQPIAEAHIDDARHRIGAVDGRGTVGEDLDPVDRGRGDEREVDESTGPTPQRGTVAVEQHQRRLRAEATQIDAGTIAQIVADAVARTGAEVRFIGAARIVLR